MATMTAPEYVTKDEIDLRMSFRDKNTEILISSMKEVLNERIDKIQTIIEKNASDMRAEVSDIRGDVKALSSQVNSMEKQIDGVNRRIDDMHQSQTKWFTLFGILIAIVPIAIALIQNVAK